MFCYMLLWCVGVCEHFGVMKVVFGVLRVLDCDWVCAAPNRLLHAARAPEPPAAHCSRSQISLIKCVSQGPCSGRSATEDLVFKLK